MPSNLGGRTMIPCACMATMEGWRAMPCERASLGDRGRTPCDCEWVGGRCHVTLGGCHACMGGWRAKLCDPGASPQLCAGSVCRSVGSVAGCTGHKPRVRMQNPNRTGIRSESEPAEADPIRIRTWPGGTDPNPNLARRNRSESEP